MKPHIEDRVRMVAEHYVANRSTVRDTAESIGVSKSTVHIDLTRRLPKVCPTLYNQAAAVLKMNKDERHIRGGLATQIKHRGGIDNG